MKSYIDLVKYCSIYIANALEILQLSDPEGWYGLIIYIYIYVGYTISDDKSKMILYWEPRG